MELNSTVKEIEITIKLNKEEAHILNELILFAMDFDAKYHRFTDDEERMAATMNNFLEKVE